MPDSKVSGRNGSFNMSKHLKCRRSIRVSTHNLLEDFPRHPESHSYLSRIVGTGGDRAIELFVLGKGHTLLGEEAH